MVIPSLSRSSSRTVKPYLKVIQTLITFRRGGLEILFSNERKHTIQLPTRLSDGSQPNIAYLLRHLVDNVMKDQRKELFIIEDNVYDNEETNPV